MLKMKLLKKEKIKKCNKNRINKTESNLIKRYNWLKTLRTLPEATIKQYQIS